MPHNGSDEGFSSNWLAFIVSQHPIARLWYSSRSFWAVERYLDAWISSNQMLPPFRDRVHWIWMHWNPSLECLWKETTMFVIWSKIGYEKLKTSLIFSNYVANQNLVERQFNYFSYLLFPYDTSGDESDKVPITWPINIIINKVNAITKTSSTGTICPLFALSIKARNTTVSDSVESSTYLRKKSVKIFLLSFV